VTAEPFEAGRAFPFVLLAGQLALASDLRPRSAGTEVQMPQRARNDPYKGFNFPIAFGATLAAIAGFALVRKLMPGVSAKFLNPNDYVKDIPASGRPIEGVGTTVATLPDPSPPPPPPPPPPKKRRSSRPAARNKSGSGFKQR
jgi:hypothetical protein